VSTFSECVLAVATEELGNREEPKGSNAGPEIEKYLRSVGLGPGYSWCMAFVFWCTEKTRIAWDQPNPLVKTAGVLDQWRRMPAERKKTVPQVGDVFIMDFGKGMGHTGFVTRVHNDHVHTIEGNTNDEGSREGYEVARRIRKISTIKGFIRI